MTCYQIAGISLGTLSLATKPFLVLTRHSPTQHLQKDGISLPSDSRSPSVVRFSVSLVHAIVSPAFFSTELDQQLAPVLSLTEAGQSHAAFAHSMIRILLLHHVPSYFILIFSCFQNLSCSYLLIFSTECSHYHHAE